MDSKVIAAVEAALRTPQRVKQVIDRALQLARERRKQEPDNTKKLEADIKRLERERDNVTAACAEGRIPPASLLAAIQERDEAIKGLKVDLALSPHRLKYQDADLEALRAVMVERRLSSGS